MCFLVNLTVPTTLSLGETCILRTGPQGLEVSINLHSVGPITLPCPSSLPLPLPPPSLFPTPSPLLTPFILLLLLNRVLLG